MTPQYWGMHETGRVPSIHKPAVQRKLIDALNAAAALAEPLTVADLQAELSAGPELADGAGHRTKPSVSPPAPDPVREAVFPTCDGPVVIRYPAVMTSAGVVQLECYLSVLANALRGGADHPKV